MPADCNQDGVEDFQEVAAGSSPDCDSNRVPDECDILPVNYGPASRQEIPFPEFPGRMLDADLDGDGLPDLAVLFSGLPPFSQVGVFLNDGLGGLQGGRIHSLDDIQESLAAVDIDSDGDMDLVATGGSLASVHLNAGDGSFGPGPSLELVPGTVSVAFGDFDRDGDLDLAAAASFQLVIVENADGVFPVAQSFNVGADPTEVIAADLDGDSDVDLATGNVFENVSVFLNGGAGTFEAGRNYAAGGSLRSLEAADLDADGDADLAAGVVTGVSVLLNRGDAHFLNPSRSSLGADVTGMSLGDLDGDADLDIAAAADGKFAFVPNHGVGVFGPGRAFEQIPARALEAVDLDLDGTTEVAVFSLQISSLTVVEKGSTRNSPDCNSDAVPDVCQLIENDCNSNSVPDDCDIATGTPDCNSNGRPDECDDDCNRNRIPDDCDIARGSSADCNANRRPDECDIQAHVDFTEAGGVDRFSVHQFLEIADIDRDGDQDLIAMVSVAGGAIRVFLNDGAGTFDAIPDQAANGGGSILQIGDLDGDGDPDLVLLARTTILGLLNDGHGGFVERVSAELDGPLRVADRGDLDGDGDMEVVTTIEGGAVSILSLGQGGAFAALGGFEAMGNVHALLLSDFDSDGDLDLALSMLEQRLLRTFSNDGTGRFGPWRDSSVDRPGDPTIAVDVTGDGLPDLVQASPVRFRRNRGDGSFESARDIPLAMPSPVLAASDFDRDGRTDLAIGTMVNESCSPTSMVHIFLGDGAGGFGSFEGPKIDGLSVPAAVRSGDLDGDGAPDLAVLTRPECPCCEGPIQTGIFTVLNRTSPASSPDLDRNRIPDECEGKSIFRRGDASDDGKVDITDGVYILDFLFTAGEEPSCLEAANANDDQALDLTDAIHVLRFLFLSGPAPPAPGPERCGPDPSAGSVMGCGAYGNCA